MKNLNKSNINLTDWEFEFQQRGDQPVLMADYWCRAMATLLQSEVGLPVQNYDYLFNGNGMGFVKSAHKAKMMEVLREEVAAGRQVQEIMDKTAQRVNEFSAVADEIVVDLSSVATKSDVLDLYMRMNDSFLKFIPWFYIPYYVVQDDLIINQIRQRLLNFKTDIESVTDFDNAFAILNYPKQRAGFQLEQDMFFELVGRVTAGETFDDVKPTLEEYLVEFGWMSTYIFVPSEIETTDDLFKRITAAQNDGSVEEYTKTQTAREKNEEIREQLIAIISGDAELMKWLDYSELYGYGHTANVEEAFKATAKLIPLYKRIATELAIPYELWANFTHEEIVAGLSGADTITTEALQERTNAFVLMIKDGGLYSVYGEEGKDFGELIEREVRSVTDEVVTEIKGQIAMKGAVTGKVRVCITSEESQNLEEGEILVTAMTTPDFVPAMKRAAAIVTDEGGLLCHAAIMSREFGKPCIISTKNATQLLKDGMEVEVDADEGIVRVV